MPTVIVENEKLEALSSALNGMLPWLKPSSISIKLAQLVDAVATPVKRVGEAVKALIDEHVMLDESGNPKSKPLMNNYGKVVGMDFDMKEPAEQHGKEFQEGYRQIMEADTHVLLPVLLNEADFDKMERFLVMNADAPAPNYVALLCVMDGGARRPTPAAAP